MLRWVLLEVKILPPGLEGLRDSEVTQKDDGLLAMVMTWLITAMSWLVRVVTKVIAREVETAWQSNKAVARILAMHSGFHKNDENPGMLFMVIGVSPSDVDRSMKNYISHVAVLSLAVISLPWRSVAHSYDSTNTVVCFQRNASGLELGKECVIDLAQRLSL